MARARDAALKTGSPAVGRTGTGGSSAASPGHEVSGSGRYKHVAADDLDDDSVEEGEESSASDASDSSDGLALAQPGARRWRKRRRKRRQALACCLCTVGALLGLASLLYLVGHSIASSALQMTKLSIVEMRISEPTQDSFRFDGVLGLSGVMVPTSVKEMDLEARYESMGLGRVQTPPMFVLPFVENQINMKAQTFRILNMSLFRRLVRDMLLKPEVVTEVEGRTDLKLFNAIPLDDLHFDREVPLGSFNGLRDVEVVDFDLSHSTEADVVVRVGVCLRNPSSVSIQNMGDIQLEALYRGSKVGTFSSVAAGMPITADAPSHPDCVGVGPKGYNSLRLSGRLQPERKEIAEDLVSRYLSGEISQLVARGVSCTQPLYEVAVQGLEIASQVRGDPTPLVTGVELRQISMVPLAGNQVSADLGVKVDLRNPLGERSSIEILRIGLDANLTYAGKLIGFVKSRPTEVPKPRIIRGRGSLDVKVSSVMTLANGGADMAAFAKDVFKRNSISLSIDGMASAEARSNAVGYNLDIGGLRLSLPVTLNGMGGMPDIEMLGYEVPGAAPIGTDGCRSRRQCGVAVKASARIENPSAIGLTVSDFEARIETEDGVPLGVVHANTLDLLPGKNVFSFSGRIFPSTPSFHAAFGKLVAGYLRGEEQQAIVVGTRVGGDSAPWMRGVAEGLRMKVPVQGVPDTFEPVQDVRVASMSASISPRGEPLVTGTVEMKVALPSEISMSMVNDVSIASTDLNVLDTATGGLVGAVDMKGRDVDVRFGGGRMSVSFRDVPVTVKNEETTATFIKDLLLASSRDVSIDGRVSAYVDTVLGKLRLDGFHVQVPSSVSGFNSFAGIGLRILDVNLVGGTDHALDLRVDFDVTNPNEMGLSVGPVTLDLWTSGQEQIKIGEVSVVNLEMKDGIGTVTSYRGVRAKFIIPRTPHEAWLTRVVLSNYIKGVDQQVEARGSSENSGSSFKLVRKALEAVHMPSVLPGNQGNMLIQALMRMPDSKTDDLVPTTVVAKNPFGSTFVITHAEFWIYPCMKYGPDHSCQQYNDERMAEYDHDMHVEVGPHEQVTMPWFTSKVLNLMDYAVILTFQKAMAGEALFRVTGSISFRAGNCPLTVDFAQANILACLDGGACQTAA